MYDMRVVVLKLKRNNFGSLLKLQMAKQLLSYKSSLNCQSYHVFNKVNTLKVITVTVPTFLVYCIGDL